MLEKVAFKVLNVIASMSVDGENLVVHKSEILSLLEEEMSVESLDSHMEALEINDMINILFSDANLYCLALKPKGKLVSEKNRQAEIAAAAAQTATLTEEVDVNDLVAPEPTDTEGVNKPFGLKKFILICAGSSFLGSFIASIIAFLIVRFA